MQELEAIRQRLLALRLKAEKLAADLRKFEDDIRQKLPREEKKKPPE